MSLTKKGAIGSGTEKFDLHCSVHGLIHTAMVPSGIAGIERIFEMIWTKHLADSETKTVDQTVREFYAPQYGVTSPPVIPNPDPLWPAMWVDPIPQYPAQQSTLPPGLVGPPDPIYGIWVDDTRKTPKPSPKKPAEPKFTKPSPPWKNRKIIL